MKLDGKLQRNASLWWPLHFVYALLQPDLLQLDSTKAVASKLSVVPRLHKLSNSQGLHVVQGSCQFPDSDPKLTLKKMKILCELSWFTSHFV